MIMSDVREARVSRSVKVKPVAKKMNDERMKIRARYGCEWGRRQFL